MQSVDQPQNDNDEQENADNGQLQDVFENDFGYYYVVQCMIKWIRCQMQNWKFSLQFLQVHINFEL